MGGERGSTARMRLAGKACCFCRISLPAPYPARERACSRCEEQKTVRLVYMRFERCMGWRVTFRDLEDTSRQFREITFADSGKIETLIARTATRMVLEDRQALGNGLHAGLGAVHLTVTQDQYRMLLRQETTEVGIRTNWRSACLN